MIPSDETFARSGQQPDRPKFVPLIIIGAARSGTNMLRDLLSQLPGVATWPCDEINYIWRHYNVRTPHDELVPSQATPRVQRYIRKAFASVARQNRCPWVLEKTCANSLRVDFVRAVFPEARFLFLVRDGRDVVTSARKRWKADVEPEYLMRKARFVPLSDLPYYAVRYAGHRLRRISSLQKALPTWGPRFRGIDQAVRERTLDEVCSLQWMHCMEKAAESLRDVPAEQVYHVRYESFTADPVSNLARICEWLGCQVNRDTLDELATAVSKSSSARWETQMDTTTLKRIEDTCGGTLERFGYSRAHTILRSAA